MESLKKLLNGQERKEYLIDMKALVDLGWEFDSQNDYELFSPESSLPEGNLTFETYEDFVKNAEVMIVVHSDGSTTYLSAPKGGDWSQADAFVPTGDDEQTIEDLIKLGY